MRPVDVTAYHGHRVAERAGVEPAYVDRLFDLGIVVPDVHGEYSAGDVPRVRLVRTLERGGVPLEAVAQAMQRGELSLAFMDNPFYERFASLTSATFEELAEQSGVPIELLMIVREAIGFGVPRPDDRTREDELRIAPLLKRLLEMGSRPAVVERLLRVYGESMRRVAEMEGNWWHTEVEVPLLESGMGEREMMEASHRLSAELTALQEKALLEIYHAQHEHAATKNIIEDIESALAKAGIYSRVDKPPAICFLDLSGYTRLTEERGDEAAAELAANLSRMVRRTSMDHGGKPVKWLGDGVMFYFPGPSAGVMAALDMVEEADRARLPPARVGLHAGPVLYQEGDYFGRTVNTAARIADYARPGEVLVSREVVEASEPGVTFADVGLVELKGVTEAIHLFAAARSPRRTPRSTVGKRPA